MTKMGEEDLFKEDVNVLLQKILFEESPENVLLKLQQPLRPNFLKERERFSDVKFAKKLNAWKQKSYDYPKSGELKIIFARIDKEEKQ